MELIDLDLNSIIKTIAHLNLAIEISPNDASLYLERGKHYHKIFNYNLAIKDFEKALTLVNCDIPEAYYNLALAYANKNKVFDFVKNIGDIVRLDDDDTNNHTNYIFGDIPNLEKAVFYLEELLKHSPSHTQAISELNIIKQKLEKQTK
jgi:tetratricopeptide (TPR) repeat protein